MDGSGEVWNPDCVEKRMSNLNDTPRRTEPIADLDFSAAYRVAVLLTGNTRSAEEAVAHVIESTNLDAVTNDELFERTVTAATGMGSSSEYSGFVLDEMELLPYELQEVAHLPEGLRQPFVLRVLLSMSRDSSARLLDLDAGAVDQTAGLAAQVLARSLARRTRRVN